MAVDEYSIYSQRFDYAANGCLIYLGLAVPGTASSAAIWQIRRFTYDSQNNLETILMADGNVEFDNVWDDRASLSYS